MLTTLKFWDKWELDITELGLDESAFSPESKWGESFDDGTQRQSTKENFEAYDKVICGMSNSFQKSDFLVHRNIWLLS